MMTTRTAIAAGSVALAAMLFAPSAHAAPLTDAEQQYVKALENAGVTSIDGNDSEMAQGGWETCQLLASGLNHGAVMGQVLRETMNRLTIDQAEAVVDAATQYLCPPTEGA